MQGEAREQEDSEKLPASGDMQETTDITVASVLPLPTAVPGQTSVINDHSFLLSPDAAAESFPTHFQALEMFAKSQIIRYLHLI